MAEIINMPRLSDTMEEGTLAKWFKKVGDSVKEGEILIVPKGVEHRPRTNGEIVYNLLFEPKTTLHTGSKDTEMTVKDLEWI